MTKKILDYIESVDEFYEIQYTRNNIILKFIPFLEKLPKDEKELKDLLFTLAQIVVYYDKTNNQVGALSIQNPFFNEIHCTDTISQNTLDYIRKSKKAENLQYQTDFEDDKYSLYFDCYQIQNYKK